MAADTERTMDLTAFGGHVLHVVERGVAGRWGPMLRQTIWGLAESGVPTSLLTNEAELADGLAGTPVAVHRVAFLSGWRGWRVPGYLRSRFDPPPAIVHLWGTGGLSWVGSWARRAGVQIVAQAMSGRQVMRLVWTRGQVTRVSLARRLLETTLNITPDQINRSETGATEVHRGETSAAQAGWHVIPPAVAMPLPKSPAPRTAGALGVLCLVRYDDERGLRTVLDALLILRDQRRDVQVVVVGSGHGLSQFWRQLRAQDLHGMCVTLDDPRLWEKGVAGADVCLLPSAQRDLWLAPLMAMGMGKLVIASQDQPADWYLEGRTAWLFAPGRADELAGLLARAADEPQKAAETGAAAAQYFHAAHSISGLVGRLLALYRAVAEGRAAAPGSAESRGVQHAE